MYELNGQQYSLEEVQAAADQSNLSLQEYIAKANIKMLDPVGPDFQLPTTPGAVVEGTVAPDMDYNSGNFSLDSIIQENERKKTERELALEKEIQQRKLITDARAETTFGKMINSVENAVLRIRGFDDRLTLATRAVATKIFGDEAIDKFVENPEVNDFWKIGLSDQDVENAVNEINKLEALQGKTGEITTGFQKGDAGEIVAGVFNAITSFGSSAVIGATTAGSGILTDFFADSYKRMNEERAEELGVDAIELMNSEDAEFYKPLVLGTTAGALERVGIKGVGKAIGKIKSGSGKKIANRFIAGSREAVTEYTQGVLEAVESPLVKRNYENVGEAAWDYMRSKEGFESFLQGFAGGAGVTTGGTLSKKEAIAAGVTTAAAVAPESTGLLFGTMAPFAMKNAASEIRSPQNVKNIDKLANDIADLHEAKINVKDKDIKASINATIADKQQEIVNIISIDNEKINNIPESDLKEINNIKGLAQEFNANMANLNKKLRVDKTISLKEFEIAKASLLEKYKANRKKLDEKLSDISIKNQNISDENASLIKTIKTSKNDAAIEKAKNDLVENNRGFIEKLIKSTFNPNLDTELTEQDYRAAINLEFAKIINTYKLKEKVPFGAYLQQTLPKRLPAIFKTEIETTPEGEIVTKTDITQEKNIIDENNITFERTESKAKEQLRDIAGITKESVQKDATQILKGKLPGIIEKSGRDKNEILTAINKAADFKIADAVLEEMGGNFNNKQEQNSRFTTFMDVNYDAIIKAIPNSVKNKLALFEAKQVGRETMQEGDQAGKGVFEYKTPTKQEFINFYTEGKLNGLRAKKKRLAGVLAQEIGKDAIAEVLADPNVQKEFLERQELQGKEIPQDAIPKLLEKIDRALEAVDQFGKTTLQGGPIPVVPAAKVFLKSLKALIKGGAKFSEALSKAIKKFKQALKGATKEQKSLAERIVGYHIKTIDDFNKLKESELIEDLNLFMNNDILNSSDIQDFASNAKDWKLLVKNVKDAGPAINMRTEAGRKKFLEIAEKNGFIEQIPESVWLTLQGTTDSLIPDKVKKELNLDKEERKTIRAADGSSLRTYGGNFPFKNVPEAKAWIASMKAKGKKFAEEGVYKDMTKKVTKAQYDNLENLLNDKDFIQSQKNSLEGVKKLFLTFESLMKKNPKQNIPFVAAMLSSTSAFQGHFMRIAAPVTFYEKGYKNVPYTQEHLMQASTAAKYLFLQAADGNIKKSFKYVAKNYQQGALTNKSDKKLKGIGYNGQKFNYTEKTPPNWFIKDNIWARYFNINTALQDGGLLPENFVTANGKTIADIYKVNNAGYGIKGVNFNNEVVQDFKADEINTQAVKQVYKEKDLNKDFNNFLEKATGIGAQKVFSEAKAIARGKQTRKVFGDYFIPPGAEDFGGLMHRTLAKGKIGEQQLKFYKENLYDPFNAANESITRERRALTDDFRALKKKLSNVPNKLKNLTSGGDFTISNAVRAYIWNKQGMKIPGLSETDLQALINEVQNDSELLDFSNQLINITKSDGYVKPENNWLSGNIATDLMALFNASKRSKHLEVWQNNVDQIFTKENLNKLEAAYGKNYRVNLEKTLERMKTGMNRKWGGDKTIQAYLDWVNGSVGAIMFLNTRSAVLQTISNINYINFKDNNPLLAAKAYANQPQFWKDFKTIFNSDYLQERRGGNQINVNENELAQAAEKGGVQGTISLLLNKGFIFTKIADSFAIASGGAPMYRNRINTYIKQGLSQKEAEDKAFLDFKAITEETQQSSRPDRISEQQASNAGRLLLAFANTPMQYNRIIKRNAQDLVDGRGDPKEKVTKIIYYSTIQNLLFNAMQKALFALAFAGEDEDEEEIEKYSQVASGMADSLLRGSGLTGNAVVAVKNIAFDIADRAKRPRPNFQDAAWKALTISPPLHNKASKLRGAGYSLGYVTPENVFEPKLDNPALSAGANIISATTNVPLDRALRKAQNIEAAMSNEAEWWQTTALLMGWGTWELGMENEKDKKEKQVRDSNIRESNRKPIKREKQRKTF